MTDLMPILGYDAIEFYVGNARQAAHYYRTAFGFEVVGYTGPEHGVRDRCSYVLEQGTDRFVVTAGLDADSPIVEHQAAHGDGVHDVAFAVPECRAGVLDRHRSRRHASHAEPFVEEDDTARSFAPRSRPTARRSTRSSTARTTRASTSPGTGHPSPGRAEATGLHLVDHVVANVDLGEMDSWADFYADIMGFSQLHHFDDEAISTEYTALMSKVLWDGEGRIKLPINEPARARRRARSRSISTSTARRVSNTWHSATTTSSTPSARCAPTVSAS